MKITAAIKHFKTQVALAAALNLSQPAVSNWVKRGRIPSLQQLRIQSVTKGSLKADRSITV